MQTEPETISPADYTGTSASLAGEVGDPPAPASYIAVEQQVADVIAGRDDLIARQAAEIAALHKQRDAEKQIADEMEDARRDWEDLKDRAKAAKERFDTLAEALAKLVRGDVQTEVGEFSDGAGPKQTTLADAISDVDKAITTAEALKAKIAAGDVLTIKDMDWTAVELSALSSLASTGKPARVKPLTVMGLQYALTDVQFNGAERVAVLAQILDAESFDARYPNASRRAVPNDTDAEMEGDPQHGLPVKVGRKVFWLSSMADALLLKIPAEAAIGGEAEADDTGHDEPGE